MNQRLRLAIFTTHPIQYQAPLWRSLAAEPSFDVRVYFGSDFSVRGYVDQGFGVRFAWDIPLTEGYGHEFLITDVAVQDASHICLDRLQVKTRIQHFAPQVALLCGYAPIKFYGPIIWLLLQRHIPLLLRGEVTDQDRARQLLQHLFRAVALRGLYKQFSGLLAIGENARQHYRTKGVPESKIFWSPYGVDTNWFEHQATRWESVRDTVRQTLGFTRDQPVFIFCGKLIPKKDPLIIAAALGILMEQDRLVPGLIVVGDGELHDALCMALAATPAVRAVFVGFQNQSEVGKYYAAADCLILPSLWGETWGLVVNEALYFGRPAIVSDRVGCWRDLISEGQTGSVFPAGDAAALADRIRHMLAWLTESRDSISAACRDKVTHYSTAQAVAGIRRAALTVLK